MNTKQHLFISSTQHTIVCCVERFNAILKNCTATLSKRTRVYYRALYKYCILLLFLYYYIYRVSGTRGCQE